MSGRMAPPDRRYQGCSRAISRQGCTRGCRMLSVPWAPSKDGDAATPVPSCGDTRGSPCSSQPTETAATCLFLPQRLFLRKKRRPESCFLPSSQGDDNCFWFEQAQATDHWERGRSLTTNPLPTPPFLKRGQDGPQTHFPIFSSDLSSRGTPRTLGKDFAGTQIDSE